jgi:hypothetical protein
MGDQTTADQIVSAKSASVVAENLKLALATPSGSVTPSTITAMVGINQGTALRPSAEVIAAIQKLDAVPNTSPYYGDAQTAITNLTALQGQLGFGGYSFPGTSVSIPGSTNHAAFGSFINQAKGHVDDSVELKKATNFISDSKFEDFGSGITNMGSLTTQGLDGSFGSLSSAANAITAAGPCFDLKDMGNFGTGTGLVNKLNTVKLGNNSGVNSALAKNGVDLTRLDDPVYSDTITKTLKSINDPATISTVKNQFGITPFGSLTSLNDFTDLNKLANPTSITGLTGGLTGMGGKFGDLGAKFPDASSAASMLNNISVPNVPNLNAAAPSLNSLISSQSTVLNNLTGTGTGTLGMPSMTDFTQSVAGGPAVTALNADVNASTIAALEASTAKASSLFLTAGIDFTTPPPNKLSSSMGFATNLHKFGTNSEMSGILSNMAVPGSQYGDAIKASLAEGKNKALMAANGIKPLNFQG